MIFWILLLITIIGIFILLNDDMNTIGMIFTIFGGMCFIAALIIMIVNNSTQTTQKFELENEYNSIQRQIETCNYKDDIFYQTVKEYNNKIINGKYYQRNVWVGIFVPNIYDEFEIVEFEDIKCRED